MGRGWSNGYASTAARSRAAGSMNAHLLRMSRRCEARRVPPIRPRKGSTVIALPLQQGGDPRRCCLSRIRRRSLALHPSAGLIGEDLLDRMGFGGAWPPHLTFVRDVVRALEGLEHRSRP